MAVIVPKGDYQKEGQLLDALESMDIVESATGLANIEVGDDGKYILVDRLGPREFSSIATWIWIWRGCSTASTP